MISENLVKSIEQTIKECWKKKALSDYDGATLSYAETAGKILWLHHIFAESGVKKGDKISLLGRNSANWAVTYLATISYGAVIVPILPDFHKDEVRHIINHSDSVLLFVSAEIYEKIEESTFPALKGIFSLSDLSLQHTSDSRLDIIVENARTHYLQNFKGHLTPDNFRLPEIDNPDLAAIVYTSGTTGFSKGAMLSHNCLIANVKFFKENIAVKPGNAVLSFLPLAHAFGCAFEFLSPVVVGCHITFLAKMPTPKVLIKSFDDVKPRLILSVPLIIEKIYRKQVKPAISKKSMAFLLKTPILSGLIKGKILKKLETVFGGEFIQIIIGGAPLNSEVESFLRKIGFRYSVGYGMTECGPLISYTPWDSYAEGSVGKCIDPLELKIDSHDPRNVIGEILVRGENVMYGYYKNKEATDEVIDKDGWLHTGDLGLVDENGFVYIKGRCKNMILSASGQNIYPEEIEAKLDNMPFVQESLIIERNGQINALVYPDFDTLTAEGLGEKDLAGIMEKNRADINTMLPAYSQIVSIKIYPEEFEKTPTKKIKRRLYNIL